MAMAILAFMLVDTLARARTQCRTRMDLHWWVSDSRHVRMPGPSAARCVDGERCRGRVGGASYEA